jgi:hypothetical protein
MVGLSFCSLVGGQCRVEAATTAGSATRIDPEERRRKSMTPFLSFMVGTTSEGACSSRNTARRLRRIAASLPAA